MQREDCGKPLVGVYPVLTSAAPMEGRTSSKMAAKLLLGSNAMMPITVGSKQVS